MNNLKAVRYIKSNYKIINKYIIAWLHSLVVESGIFYLLLYVIKLTPSFSNTSSLFCSGMFNYFISRVWVFSKSKHGIFKEFSLFCLTFLFSLLLSYLVFNISFENFALSPPIAKALSIFVTVAFNYVLKKYLVFKA